MSYPTWQRADARTVQSQEQRDGVPDFLIVYEAGSGWCVKWRTSACWSGPYARLADAQASVSEGLR